MGSKIGHLQLQLQYMSLAQDPRLWPSECPPIAIRHPPATLDQIMTAHLKDEMTLKSRGPIPLYMNPDPYMVYEPQNLFGFISSLRHESIPQRDPSNLNRGCWRTLDPGA